MRKILIVEDQNLIIKSITLALEKEYEVISLNSFQDAKNFEIGDIDVILLDISLGDGSGLDLFKIFKTKKDVNIIFLTANDNENTIVEAFGMGADDYITKPFKIGELRARIKKLLPNEIIFKNIVVDISSKLVKLDGENITLSSKEYDLLEYLIRNKNKVLTRDNLLAIWELENQFVNDNTLSVNIKRLREKLNLTSLITIKNVGYMIDETK